MAHGQGVKQVYEAFRQCRVHADLTYMVMWFSFSEMVWMLWSSASQMTQLSHRVLRNLSQGCQSINIIQRSWKCVRSEREGCERVRLVLLINTCNTFVQTPEVGLVISRGIKMHVGCHPLLLKCDYYRFSPAVTNRCARTQLPCQEMINCLRLGGESRAEVPIWFLPSSWDIAERFMSPAEGGEKKRMKEDEKVYPGQLV